MLEQRIAALFMPHGAAHPACITSVVVFMPHNGVVLHAPHFVVVRCHALVAMLYLPGDKGVAVV